MRRSIPALLVVGQLVLANTALAVSLCTTKGGAVHLRASCKKKETAIDPLSLSGTGILRSGCQAMPAPPEHTFITLDCPTGMRAIGGGVGIYSDATCTTASGEATITFSAARAADQGWTGDAVLSQAVQNFMQVQVVCAARN